MRASRLVVYGVAIVAVLYFLPWMSFFFWTIAIPLAVDVVLMLMFSKPAPGASEPCFGRAFLWRNAAG